VERIQSNAYVVPVHSLHYIVGSTELVDGAGGYAAKFQGDADTVARELVCQIAQTLYGLILNLLYAQGAHIESGYGDQHLHAHGIGHFDDEVHLVIDFLDTSGIPLNRPCLLSFPPSPCRACFPCAFFFACHCQRRSKIARKGRLNIAGIRR